MKEGLVARLVWDAVADTSVEPTVLLTTAMLVGMLEVTAMEEPVLLVAVWKVVGTALAVELLKVGKVVAEAVGLGLSPLAEPPSRAGPGIGYSVLTR